MERTALKDFWKREFKYLRLSVTEVCNFRCTYCLPNGYQPNPSTSNPLMMKPQFLSVAEIQNLASAFSDLGIKKVRLTGGEPTLRQDLAQIISVLKNTPAIQTVALTTNAWNLDKKLSEYKSVGLDQLNISLDSLNAETFFSVTGKDLALKIKSFIDQALQMNFESVKLNVVLLKGINDQEIPQFMDWVKDRPLDVRFIELMRTDNRTEYFQKYHVSPQMLIDDLQAQGWSRVSVKKGHTGGPAINYQHPQHKGRLGFISAYSPGFCDSCNRLRVSARGDLRLCLWGEGQSSLRELLQSPEQKDDLKDKIQELLKLKPERHRLLENISGDMATLSSIGG